MIKHLSKQTIRRKEIVAIVGILSLYLGFMFQMYTDPLLWSVLGNRFGIGNSYVLALTISGLFSAVVTPVAAKLNTMYAAKKIMLISAFCCLILYPTQAFVHHAAVLLPLRALIGTASSFMYTTVLKVIGDIFPPERRGFWIGIQGTLMGVASIIVPPATGWLIDCDKITAVFFFTAPLYFSGILCLWRTNPLSPTGKENPTAIPWKSAFFIAAAMSCFFLLTARKDIPFSSRTTIALILLGITASVIAFFCEKRAGEHAILPFAVCRDRNFLLIVAASFTSAASAAFLYYSFAYYMLTYMNASALETGIAVGLQFFITLFLAPIYGKFLHRKEILQCSIFGSGIVMLLLYIGFIMFLKTTTPLVYVNISMILFGIYAMVISVIYPFAAQNLVTETQRSYAVGGYKLATSLGYVIPLAIFTALLNALSGNPEFGYDIIYFISILLTLLTIILTMKIKIKT